MAGLGNALSRPFSGQRIKDAGVAGINPKRGLKMFKEDAADIFKAPTASIAGGSTPTADDADIDATRRRRMAIMQRGTRMNTVLTGDTEQFGG